MAPLILTLKMEEDAERFFEGRRQEHFPSALNFIPAHVTLFHHLPGDRGEIAAGVKAAAEKEGPISIRVCGVRNLGRGVAYQLESEGLLRIRKGLAGLWTEWLTRQDQQPYKPHVTVQNKVSPEVSRALFHSLQAEFSPFNFSGTGLDLWRYLGGPWEHLHNFWFQGRGEEVGVAAIGER